ncbi:hypothetical protein FQN60_003594 [Etheostoma spectabile]|uniref:Uncharacterized protein n=1 Tax=Etheostoma spectabile TaxID=54343 RepID=A0A5J5CWD4_9PERO|nr:hypothetical protein FQN60_003594 [Etheostoma spectabile]
MEANAAGAVQEAHHGAVWRSEPGVGAATHSCCPRLPVGIPLQTLTSLPYKVLIVLFFISRRQFLPSNSKQEEYLVKPAHRVLEVKPASPWLHKEASLCFVLKSCKLFHKRHYGHSRVQAVSNGTGHDISTHITSRDSTCTRTERLRVMRKHEKLEKAALREIYSHSRAITEIKEVVGSTMTTLLETVGSVVAHLWPTEPHKCLKVDCGKTLRTSTEWTCGRVRAVVLVFLTFVADFNTLML